MWVEVGRDGEIDGFRWRRRVDEGGYDDIGMSTGVNFWSTLVESMSSII